MMQVGFTGAVANAVTEVKNRVCVVSDFNGGYGAVREIIEFILKAKGIWNEIVSEYLSPEMPEVKNKEPFYMLANKSNQAAPSTPVRQNPTRPVSQPQQARATQPNQPARPQPAQPVKSTQPAQRPIQPVRPQAIQSPQPSKPAQPPQPERDKNVEKLDELGKKLNFKF